MINRRECKKELKHCAAKISLVEKVFKRELSKPVEERDNALIDECLETLQYLESVFAELSRKLKNKDFDRSSSIPHILSPKWIAICFVLVILLACTIAQALGFRVWSALIHWDANYLYIGYIANAQPSVLPLSMGSDASSDTAMSLKAIGYKEYPSIDAALSDLGFNSISLIPSYMASESEIRIRGIKDSANMKLRIDYYYDGGHMINYEINHVCSQANAALAFTAFNSSDEYEIYQKDNIDYIIVQLDDATFVTWNSDDYLCSITSSFSYEKTLDMIDSLTICKH